MQIKFVLKIEKNSFNGSVRYSGVYVTEDLIYIDNNIIHGTIQTIKIVSWVLPFDTGQSFETISETGRPLPESLKRLYIG